MGELNSVYCHRNAFDIKFKSLPSGHRDPCCAANMTGLRVLYETITRRPDGQRRVASYTGHRGSINGDEL